MLESSTNVKIETTAFTIYQGEYDGDSWERPNSTTDFIVGKYCQIVQPRQFYDLAYPGKLFSGDTVFAVWVRYDTGDSFHTDSGQYVFVALTRHESKAIKLCEDIVLDARIRIDHPNILNTDYFRITFVHDDETPEKINTYTWKGYFDQFRKAEYGRLTVK